MPRQKTFEDTVIRSFMFDKETYQILQSLADAQTEGNVSQMMRQLVRQAGNAQTPSNGCNGNGSYEA